MADCRSPYLLICSARVTSRREEAVAQAHKIHRDLSLGWWWSSWRRPEISETVQIRTAPVDRRGWSEHEKLTGYEPIPFCTISLVCSAAAGGRFCALACRAENRHHLSASRTMAKEIAGRTGHARRQTQAGHRIRASSPKHMGVRKAPGPHVRHVVGAAAEATRGHQRYHSSPRLYCRGVRRHQSQ